MMKKLSTAFIALTLCLGATAQGLLDKGISAEAKGLDDLAEGYYREAADTSIAARLRLGLLLERHEHYREAISWLSQPT